MLAFNLEFKQVSECKTYKFVGVKNFRLHTPLQWCTGSGFCGPIRQQRFRRPIGIFVTIGFSSFSRSLFTWHAIIVAFSIVAGLPIVAKFGHSQLCVYMALLIIRTRALCTTK